MDTTCNSQTTLSKKEVYKHQLQSLECPFTWNLDSLSYLKRFTNHTIHFEDISNSHPLQSLLYETINICLNLRDGKTDTIEEDIKKCYEYFDTLKNSNDPEISAKVARAILQGTECFVYFELDKLEEIERELKDLVNIDNMNDKEKSTLLGCKGICWARYDTHDKVVYNSKTKDLMRKAIELNKDCSLWHYKLAKILRYERRASCAGIPGEEEANSFKTAYELSKSPFYGIFAAQMYRESRKYKEATKVYNDIYEDIDSLTPSALLRLALGLIGNNQLDQAKVCLDKAEKSNLKRSMYFHYRAKYHLKKREFKEASHCFKETCNDGNFHAEMEYFQCFLSRSEDATMHLVNLLEKYKSLSEIQLQSAILHVAVSYWKRENNLKEALKYFLKAIEIDPQAKCLMEYYSYDVFQFNCRNIYVLLEKFIFPKFDVQSDQLDKDTLKVINSIKEFSKGKKGSDE